MRLILLPISTRRTLIYCEPIHYTTPASKQTLLDKAVTRASETWAAWEKAEKGWKLKTTQWGNKMFRRIPFEEWGLKSIPPLRKSAGRRKQEEISDKEKPRSGEESVEVKYPALFQDLQKGSVMDVLSKLATERQNLHQKRMWGSIVGLPITAPVGLLPIIPNIPFFYLAFRAYSHWRALSGARHLEHLVNANVISPQPTPALDSLYAAGLLYPTRADSRNAEDPTPEQARRVAGLVRRQMTGEAILTTKAASPSSVRNPNPKPSTNPNPGSSIPNARPPNTQGPEGEASNAGEEEEILLLQGWNGKLIAERLKLPSLEIEIERAVEQVEKSIAKKGAGEMQEEKREVERVREALKEENR